MVLKTRHMEAQSGKAI